MGGELGDSLRFGERDLRDSGSLRSVLSFHRCSGRFGSSFLPRCQIDRRDSFHSVNLYIERVATR